MGSSVGVIWAKTWLQICNQVNFAANLRRGGAPPT
jgi:hypothetical protein